jgi:uncharacterized repeat protein (TIGR03803 family)
VRDRVRADTKAAGGWTETVLYSFKDNGKDGTFPQAALIFDTSGNLYGTTSNGGTGDCKIEGSAGCGTVFELTPKAGGGWTEKILHNFNNSGKDGIYPYAGLIADAAGNLYGTTSRGGGSGCSQAGCGTVFELTLKAGGGWKEKILHNFNQNVNDGNNPYAGLIADAAGNLYGTTCAGGHSSSGTVFELTPKAGGGWKEKILHYFSGGTDGSCPMATPIFDSAANLYGMTTSGGDLNDCDYAGIGCGTVFELTPKAGGGWTDKTLYDLPNFAAGGVILDAVGNLYGTTKYGGSSGNCGIQLPNGCGTVFELTPKAGGGWKEKTLHNFNQNGKDGAYPYAGLIFDAAGNLFGTTYQGGTYYWGTVFEITP